MRKYILTDKSSFVAHLHESMERSRARFRHHYQEFGSLLSFLHAFVNPSKNIVLNVASFLPWASFISLRRLAFEPIPSSYHENYRAFRHLFQAIFKYSESFSNVFTHTEIS